MGAIELQDVAVAHDGRTVLSGVQVEVTHGEVVALVGASGSGKTSLLRVIAGLDQPTSGRVLLDGQDVTDRPTHERDLGMVAQGAPMHPGIDVERNLRLPLDLRGDGRADATERVRGAALRFDLSRLLRRLPGQLSVGEQATAATARSVMRAPTALLLDEPAANLDGGARAAVLQQLGIIQRTRGTTIVIATNDIAVAAAIAQRVAVIDGGTVARVDTLTALREAPATLQIADLVAPTPLVHVSGRVEPGGPDRRTRIVTAAGALTTWHKHVRGGDGQVILGLSQHDLQLTGPADGDLSGTVSAVATTGARRLVTVDTAAERLVVDIPGGDPVPTVGDAVGVAVTRAHVARPDGDVVATLTWPTRRG